MVRMEGNSRIRQNYTREVEELINRQINMEFYADYLYLAMATHFQRDEVALHGFAKFFKDSSDEERQHGLKLINYQIQRGGRVILQDISAPSPREWSSPLEAVLAALDLERRVNQHLLTLHQVASQAGDPHLTNFLEDEYLSEQVRSISQLGNLATRLERAGPGLGAHIIDTEMLQVKPA